MTNIKVNPKENFKNHRAKHLNNILNSMNPILFVAKLIGLYYFSLNDENLLNTKNIKSTLFYNLIFLIVYFYIYWLGIEYGAPEENIYHFYAIIRKLLNGFCTAMTILQIITGFFIKFKLSCWINDLAGYDAALENFGLNLEYKKFFRFAKIIAIIDVFLLIVKMFLYNAAYHYHKVVTLCLVLYHVHKSFIRILIIFLLSHLYMRFKLINKTIKNLNILDAEPSKLIILTNFHFRLNYLLRKLNSITAFYFFCGYLLTFIVSLFFSYYFFHNILLILNNSSSFDNLSNNYIKAVFVGLTGLDEILESFVITNYCHGLCKEVNKTPKLIHGLRYKSQIIPNWDKTIMNISLEFLHQTILFTAHGFFNITYKVLFGLLEKVLTYFVLFIQNDLQA